MAVDRKLAQEVVQAHQAAGKPIASVDHVAYMWTERQAKEALGEIRRFQKAPVRKAQEEPQEKDEAQLSAMEFRDLIEQLPRELLGDVPKYMVTAVGLVMSNHCTYATGKKMQLTAKALSDMSGVGHRGVARVLDLLERHGVIVKTRGLPHAKGRPSVEYEFVRSDLVKRVLNPDPIVVHEQPIVVPGQFNVVHEQLIRS